MLFLCSNTTDDDEARNILSAFCSRFTGETRITAIEIKNTLGAFNSYHFNNSIIYKPIIPSVIPHEPFILNIDAGILLGNAFDEFVETIIDSHCNDPGPWVLSAHCNDPESNMPAAFAGLPTNKLYPAGAIFFFHTANYLTSQWYPRYIGNYMRWQSKLQYAEQELICLTAAEGELRALPDATDINIRFLGADVLNGKAQRMTPSIAEDCVFFKFAGSFKPWKYWVLDPNKSIYIRRRQLMENIFEISPNPLIEKHRKYAMRDDWELAFLKAYEQSLVIDSQLESEGRSASLA